jgi:hypothetical protein
MVMQGFSLNEETILIIRKIQRFVKIFWNKFFKIFVSVTESRYYIINMIILFVLEQRKKLIYLFE